MVESISSRDPSALAASATGAATTNESAFNADFETFLTLLTTQLTQQDPLSPMDTDKFTEQLVQFSQVEQSIKNNSNLERMLDTMQADRLTAALDYVGQWVEIEGNVTTLDDEGGARVSYTMPEGVAKASVSILNAAGETVARFDAQTSPGGHEFDWDGIGSNGQRQLAGNYWMKVDAIDAADEPVSVPTRVSGQVDGVERDGDTIALVVGGMTHSLSNIRSVRNAQLN